MSYLNSNGVANLVSEIKAKCDLRYVKNSIIASPVGEDDGLGLITQNNSMTLIRLPQEPSTMVAGRLYLADSDVSSIAEALQIIPTNYVGTFKSDASVTSVLTGGKVSAIVAGTVANLTGRIYEFFGRQANTENVYFWRITFNATYKKITVGTVYKLTGTAA